MPHPVLMKTIERFWTEVMPRVAWPAGLRRAKPCGRAERARLA